MSLTTSITDLTTQVTQLIQTVDQQDDVVRAKIAELAAMVPNTRKVFFVDTVNGDDANDGLAHDSALASLEEVNRRAPGGGVVEVYACSDILVREELQVYCSGLVVYGFDPATGGRAQRRLSFSPAAANRSDGVLAGFTIMNNGSLAFEHVDLELPKKDASVIRDAIITFWRGGTLITWATNVIDAPGGDTFVIDSTLGGCLAHFANTTFASSMAPGQGRIFRGVAAGANPNDDWRIRTNITQN